MLKRHPTISILLAAVPFMPLLGSDVLANCPWARNFAADGFHFMPDVEWAPTGAGVQGALASVVGRWWDPWSPQGANNFGGECEAVRESGGEPGWWYETRMQGVFTGRWTMNGWMSSAACQHRGCPDDELVVLVEDLGVADADADGVPDTAYFLALRVDRTPSSVRDYDFARLDPEPGEECFAGLLPCRIDATHFSEFPKPAVVKAEGRGRRIEVALDIADAGQNFQGANCEGDPCHTSSTTLPLPASSTIASYDVMIAKAVSDPGRERTAWTQLATIDYQDAAVSRYLVSESCGEGGQELYLAVGVTFHGGIRSHYVSQAIALRCSTADEDESRSRERLFDR